MNELDALNAALDRLYGTYAEFAKQPERRRADDENDRRRDLVAEVLTGDARSPFWRLVGPYTERYDVEQYVEVFAAVRRACALIGATPAERWAVVEDELRDLAIKYADYTERPNR